MVEFAFSQLSDWVKAVEERMDAVVATSTERLLETAQQTTAKGGNMPVVTGTLRGSLRSNLNGGTVLDGETSYIAVANDMRAGDVATFEWHAEYAMRVNYGFTGADRLGRVYNQSGRLFMDKALAQWDRIVAEECKVAEATVKGSL